jgi:hypothetical protein
MNKAEQKRSFESLFKEAHEHAKEKKLTSNRAGVTRHTKNNIMKLRLQINERIDKLANGAMTRICITAQIVTEVCGECHAESECVGPMQVWSKSVARGSDQHKLTAHVDTHAMFEFHHDLPIQIQRKRKLVPCCASCLTSIAEKRKKKLNGS